MAHALPIESVTIAKTGGVKVEKRGLNLFITVILIFGGMMLLRPYLFPEPVVDPDDHIAKQEQDEADQKQQADQNKADGKQDDAATKDLDAKSSQPKTKDGKQGDGAKQDDDSKSDPASKQDDAKSKTDGSAKNKSNAPDQDQKTDQDQTTVKADQPKPEQRPALTPDQLIPIGSLDSQSASRLSAAVNRQGGTLRRIYLNARRKDGRLRFRDVEPYPGEPTNPGFIGTLELTSAQPQGCTVNFVDNGSPASRDNDGEPALKPGDIVTLLRIPDTEDQVINEPRDFAAAILLTKPGQTIEVERIRNGKAVTVEIVATDRPMQTLRPEPFVRYLDEENDVAMPPSPESLQLSIRLPKGTDWPEFDESLRTGLWDVVPGSLTEHSVTLSKTIDFTKCDVVDWDGELTVYKKFSISQGETEYWTNKFDRNYHVNVEFEFAYKGNSQPEFSFELYGPTGVPVDGWWFQHKIHGESLALFRAAGARDIVAQGNSIGFKFMGGPKIVKNAYSDAPENIKILEPNQAVMQYLAIDGQYFSAALLATENEDGDREYDCYSAYVWICQPELPETKRERRTVDLSFRMFSKPIVLKDGESHKVSFELFTGPKEHQLLKQYELQNLRSFGWFAVISRPLTSLLRLFYWLVSQIGLGSYGLAIIMLTVLVRSAMIPISRKAALNAQMMQKLAPQMKEIADKNKDNMEGRLKAQRELFAKYKYNPYGGCLLMFLQLPIFIGLYRGLSVDIALRDQPLIPGFGWCSNLAGPDRLLYWESWMPQMLAGETGWLGPYLNVLPLVTVVLFLVQQKMFTPPPTDDQQKMMHRMMTFMMLFMGVLFFKVSSGLCLYFITSSLWGIIERKMLPKPKLKFDEDEAESKTISTGTTQPKESGPLRESDEDRKKRERDRRARERRRREKERQ